MKRFYILSSIIAIIFAGCTSLNVNSSEESLKANLIPIPTPKAGVETQFFTSTVIDGSVGGLIVFDRTYTAVDGSTITVHLDLTIPAGAFAGVQTINLVLDDVFAVVDCNPSMIFTQPLLLNYKYTGLKFKNLSLKPGRNGFYYIKNDGTIEPVVCSSFLINRGQGTLSVTNAVINHFSRYGWATLDGDGE